MSGIFFFEEKLGETRRNSEGGASRTGREGGAVGGVGVVGAEMGFLEEKLGGTRGVRELRKERVVIEVWRLENRGWYIFFWVGLIY